jgi:hypothetical protein
MVYDISAITSASHHYAPFQIHYEIWEIVIVEVIFVMALVVSRLLRTRVITILARNGNPTSETICRNRFVWHSRYSMPSFSIYC